MNTIGKVILMISLSILGISNDANSQSPCIPQFTSNYEYVDNFAIHTLVSLYSGTSVNGYEVVPPSLYTVSLALGKSYPISVSTVDPISYVGNFGVWIDYNNNYQFEPEEKVLVDTNQGYTAACRFTVPADSSYLGERIMRVMYVRLGENITPCDNYYSGEAEDYTISIVGQQEDTMMYCMPFCPKLMSHVFPIEEFKLGSIHNLYSGYTPTSYSLYKHEEFTTTMEMGKYYSVKISLGSIAGVAGGYAVWIDLDNDGIFEAWERVFHDGPLLKTATGTIKLPVNPAYAGLRRMRVRSAWAEVPDHACGLVRAGETEDYTILVTESTVGESELLAVDADWSISPNPSRGNIEISSALPIDEIRIQDMTGRLIFEDNPASDHLSVNLSQPGIYIATVVIGKQVSRRRFEVI
ncbi:MAG: T9SS type A sorting domain-containing protein [Bacteroidales bacterium]|nr:T9SS type A sorting domain-containing protein [Bacteroidales bacterium]